MKSRRMWAVLVVAIAGVVGSGFAIPAAVGASPRATAVTGTCIAKGTRLLGNTGVVSVRVKGRTTTGTGSCAGRLTGEWAKSSDKFSLQGSGAATLGLTDQSQGAIIIRGSGFTLTGTDLSPLTNSTVAGRLTGTGLSAGTNLTIGVNCVLSYPPLRIACTVTISW